MVDTQNNATFSIFVNFSLLNFLQKRKQFTSNLMTCETGKVTNQFILSFQYLDDQFSTFNVLMINSVLSVC